MEQEPFARLKQARIAAGFGSASEAAKALGVKVPTYTAHENGGRGIGKDDAIRYGKKFKVNPVWIMMGDIPGIAGTEAGAKIPALTPSSKIDELDVRAGAGAGGFLDTVEHTLDNGMTVSRDAIAGQWEMPDYFIRGTLRADPSGAKVMEVFGDSGYDPANPNAPGSLLPGDRVIIDTHDRRPSPPGAFAVFDGIGIVVKLVEPIFGTEPPRIRLSSRNPQYSPYEVTTEEAHIIGRVRGRITVM